MKPTSSFNRVSLDVTPVATGTKFGRIFRSKFPDPLGFGKTPSRFSDPRPLPTDERFGVVYLGETLGVCFLEAFLRDQRNGAIGDLPISESELELLSFAEIEVAETLALVDMRGDGVIRMGIPTDVARGSDQSLAREWSLAINQHPGHPDGIIYSSRLNGETNIAVYDRSLGKLRSSGKIPLMKAGGMAAILTQYKVALVP